MQNVGADAQTGYSFWPVPSVLLELQIGRMLGGMESPGTLRIDLACFSPVYQA